MKGQRRYKNEDEQIKRQYDANISEIARFITQIRLDHGITRNEFEKATGISRQVLRLWEHSKRVPTPESLGKWLAHFPKRLSVDDVVLELVRLYVKYFVDAVYMSYDREKGRVRSEKKAAAMHDVA